MHGFIRSTLRGGEFYLPFMHFEYDIMECRIAIFCAVCLAAVGEASAHGPQIQVTRSSGKIVTRELFGDGPYGTTLTAPKSVYVMPLFQHLGVWLSHPNDARLPGNVPEFPSGPGLAYGYGYDATTNPAPFPVGSQFELGFVAGLKSWNGSAFVDAGATQLEAFRGSGVNLVTARTSDAGPFASIKFPSVIAPAAGISFGADGGEVHTSVSYRMLGDGASTASALADDIYLAGLQLGSTDPAIAPSDPFYFILNKNGSPASIQAAVASLGIDPSRIQFSVPEPTSLMIAAGSLAAAMQARKISQRLRK